MKKITAIKRQKKNTNRVNVYLDGEFAFALYSTDAVQLAVGQTLSETDVSDLVENDSKQAAFQNALRLISHRPRSIQEVKDTLIKKDYPAGTIDDTLDRLQQTGLLDDVEFSHYWIDQRATFNPRGTAMLRHELRLKGVSREIIESELTSIDEEHLAYATARKWADRPSNLAKDNYQHRLSAFLTRRGFSYSVVRDVVGRLHEEIDGKLSSE